MTISSPAAPRPLLLRVTLSEGPASPSVSLGRFTPAVRGGATAFGFALLDPLVGISSTSEDTSMNSGVDVEWGAGAGEGAAGESMARALPFAVGAGAGGVGGFGGVAYNAVQSRAVLSCVLRREMYSVAIAGTNGSSAKRGY